MAQKKATSKTSAKQAAKKLTPEEQRQQAAYERRQALRKHQGIEQH
jgi:hypothetical protein